MTTHTSPVDPDWRDKPMDISPSFYGNFSWAIFVIMGIVIGFFLFGTDNGFTVNVYSEFFSIIVTVIIVDRLAQQREIRVLRDRLPRHAKSSSHAIAIGAIDELRNRGWLIGEDGLLRGKNLWYTNLERADLSQANLSKVNLSLSKLSFARLDHANMSGAFMRVADMSSTVCIFADLSDADLMGANLSRASLTRANLSKASLLAANLSSGTELFFANLSQADLRGADFRDSICFGMDLSGANLYKANFRGASMPEVIFNNLTVLPDGINWTPDTDMTRFTDANHADFWDVENHRP